MGSAASASDCCIEKNALHIENIKNESISTYSHDIRDELKNIKEAALKRIESIEDRAERYINRLHVPVERLKLIVDSFLHEVEVGLNAHKRHPNEWKPEECSFKMLDACIENLPTGDEKGVYYALDFGGCNFRLVRVELKGQGIISSSTQQYSLKNFTHKTGSTNLLLPTTTATEMFDMFALSAKAFIEKHDDLKAYNELSAGFSFSFPCAQQKINKACLITWTKEIATGRKTYDCVEGLDVVDLLNVACRRKDVPMRCVAVLNDTIGTLLSCAYSLRRDKYPECLVALILGTGMNCCYYEETAPYYGYKGKLINLECGNFNRNLPRLNVDCELDFKAVDSRGSQHIEKMCSGAYLGEICRLALIRILAEKTPAMAWQAYTLTTEILARIVEDTSENLVVTAKESMAQWQVEMPLEHLKILQKLATAVMNRSCALAATLVVGCAIKTGRLQPAFNGLTVGIDGSLYTKSSFYRKRLRYYIDAILGELGHLIHLVTSDDGSGKGAAILAAITNKT